MVEQRFRKNPMFNSIFLGGAALFASLVGFDLYHDGESIPIFLIIATLACGVSALWGRGDLVVIEPAAVRLNLGLLNRKRVKREHITKVRVRADEFVRLYLAKAGVKSVKISMALVHEDDRAGLCAAVAELAPSADE